MASYPFGKTIAQLYPSAATLTMLYTHTDSPQLLWTGLIVSNHSATADKFRLSIAVGGEADANKQYLYYDTEVLGNDTLKIPFDTLLSLNDVVRVYATNGTLSFNLQGVNT